MCKCRFCSVSLAKAGQFTQSFLFMCFVGCDEQSPWWEKHHLFRTCPWLWNFSLSRLLTSVVCSASLQCWFGEVTQLENEGAAERGGRSKMDVDSTVEILWSNVQQFQYYCDSFRIALIVLNFHWTVKALFVQTPFFYSRSRKGDSVLMAFVVRLLWIKGHLELQDLMSFHFQPVS